MGEVDTKQIEIKLELFTPSVFLFLACGSLDGAWVFSLVFFTFCEEASCSWSLFLSADFIWALI